MLLSYCPGITGSLSEFWVSPIQANLPNLFIKSPKQNPTQSTDVIIRVTSEDDEPMKLHRNIFNSTVSRRPLSVSEIAGNLPSNLPDFEQTKHILPLLMVSSSLYVSRACLWLEYCRALFLELSFSRISESTTGYTSTPCVGSFTSPGIDTR